MMRVYRLGEPETTKYRIEAERRWHLPGVRCDFCYAVWSSVGLDYPLLDLSQFASEASYTAGVVSVAEYKRLRQALLDWLPCPLMLRPGAGFGPLTGVSGEPFAASPGLRVGSCSLPKKLCRLLSALFDHSV